MSLGLLEFYESGTADEADPVPWDKLRPAEREHWVRRYDEYVEARNQKEQESE